MSLKIDTNTINEITLVQLNGSLDTNTAPEAEQFINELLDSNVNKLILDLTETKYVSSAGLRVFLATAKKVTAKGGVVKLCSPNDVVQEILDISGFSTILDVKPDVDGAINDM